MHARVLTPWSPLFPAGSPLLPTPGAPSPQGPFGPTLAPPLDHFERGPASQELFQGWVDQLARALGQGPAGLSGRMDTARAARLPRAPGRSVGELSQPRAAGALRAGGLTRAERRTARFIDRFLKEKGSPAAGKGAGAVFVRQGKKHKVRPLVLLAIAGHETGYGRLGVGLKKWLGVGAYDSNPDGRTPYDGMKNQIRYGAQTFANLRRRGGSGPKDPVRAQLRAVNRAGWATDPNWHAGVARHYQEIRGAAARARRSQARPGRTARAPAEAGAGAHPRSPDSPGPRTGSTTGARPAAAERARRPRRSKLWRRYARMVRAAGGQVCPNGQATVLGLRRVGRASTRYDDRFVVLRPDGKVKIFRGATHPGQSSSSASPDVNGDGVGDVGIIRPGNYVAVANGPHAGAASFHVRTRKGSGFIPGWRDTNHDGVYSRAERRASRRRGDTLSEILFHQGNWQSPSSIGCQTLSPAVYQDFIRAVGGPGARFTFTLRGA